MLPHTFSPQWKKKRKEKGANAQQKKRYVEMGPNITEEKRISHQQRAEVSYLQFIRNLGYYTVLIILLKNHVILQVYHTLFILF